MKKFIEKLEENPIIAAVKNNAQLVSALESNNEIIFLLGSDILTLKEKIEAIKNKNKMCFVHFDLLDGIGKNITALEYLVKEFKPDGIISTRSNIIIGAKKLGLITIQRHFIIDSISLENTIEMVREVKPDAVEILPGVISSVIERIISSTEIPIIAGGLISEKEQVVECIKKGAMGISTTNEKVWGM